MNSTDYFKASALVILLAIPQSPAAGQSQTTDLTGTAQIGEDWKRYGSLFESTTDKAVLTFGAKLPSRCSIEFEVSGGTRLPAFHLTVAGKQGARFEMWDDTLVILTGEKEFAEVQIVRSPNLRVRAFIDAGSMSVYGENGKLIATLKDIGSPGQLSFTNMGPYLAIKTLVVREWDGSPPKALKRSKSPDVIYQGPNFGRDWKTRAWTDGRLPVWSTNRSGNMVSGSLDEKIFLPLKRLPEQLELEMVIESPRVPRKDGLMRWRLSFTDSHQPQMRVLVSKKDEAGRMKGSFIVLPTPNVPGSPRPTSWKKPTRFDEALSDAWKIRVFRRNADKATFEYRFHAADGRELGRITVPKTRPSRNGIALWGQPGMEFAKLIVREWDGGKPRRSLER